MPIDADGGDFRAPASQAFRAPVRGLETSLASLGFRLIRRVNRLTRDLERAVLREARPDLRRRYKTDMVRTVAAVTTRRSGRLQRSARGSIRSVDSGRTLIFTPQMPRNPRDGVRYGHIVSARPGRAQGFISDAHKEFLRSERGIVRRAVRTVSRRRWRTLF